MRFLSGTLSNKRSTTHSTEIDKWRIVAASALHLPSAIKVKTVEAFQTHPKVCSAAVGISGGIFLGVALVDGQKAHERSVYGMIFKRKEK